MIGRKLSHFRIQAELGAGGTARVYRALDERLGRPVALKVLSPDAPSRAGCRERLLCEARSASALNHPNVITIYEIGSADGLDFLAMELVEGLGLRLAIPPGGLELERALDWALQTAEALAYAHDHGIVHRDLKPANLMVTPQGQIKILDFGLARRLPTMAAVSGTQATEALTLQGSVVGTPQYMSPEQARGLPVDARGDLFSFGCTFYEMLTGRPPFRGDTLEQTLHAILKSEPVGVTVLRPDLPNETERIVNKALEKDLAYRYQSAADLAADLRRLRRESTTGRTFSTAAAPSRRPWLMGAASFAGLSLLIGAYTFQGRRSGRPAGGKRSAGAGPRHPFPAALDRQRTQVTVEAGAANTR